MSSTIDNVNASEGSCMDSRIDAMGSYMAMDASVSVGNEFVHDSGTRMEPYIGMEFESVEAAETLYSEYAQVTGFIVRVLTTRRSKHGTTVMERSFVCSKQSPASKSSTSNQLGMNEGCKAMIKVKMMDSGRWVVTKIEKDHNHELMSSGNSHILQSYEYVYNPMNNVINSFHEGRIGLPFEPHIGMEFESEEAARVFYNEYAERVGFSIRVDVARRSRRNSQPICRQFVCSREGFHSRKYATKRPITREGCKALIRLKKEDSGKWVVTRFEKDHNHELVPSGNVSLLRSHRCMPCVADNLSNTYGQSGISQNIPPLGEKSGGSGMIGFNSVDSANCTPGVRKRRSLERDAQNVLEYFKHMQAENPAFFYAIQADEGDHITNIFWADARSKMAYSCFGDVVTFDTTYRGNMYGRPFTLFTGVDHHKHAVLFGCGLLLDESEASFVWLFNTWLKAMFGRYPDSLITDESPAIVAAMAIVFPRTRHRLCKRHILRKLPEKLGDVERASSGLKEDFFKCINMTVTNDEFESHWRSFIDKYDLRENQWLQSLYQNRDKWVQVYFQDVLFDNIPKTQISESISLFFHVDDHTTLMAFVNQCEKTIGSWYEKELEEYHKTSNMKPFLKMGFPMEIQVAEIYTKTIFLEFQEQLVQSLRYIADMTKEDGPISTFKVIEFGATKGEHTVTFNALEVCAICSCQMFEYAGILCRHILRVFIVKNVMLLPAHYIIKRWTRNAMNGDIFYEHASSTQVGSLESRTSRYDDLCHEAINFAAEGAWNLDVYRAARSALQKALEEIRAAKEKIGIVAQCISPVAGSIQQASVCEGNQPYNAGNTCEIKWWTCSGDGFYLENIILR